MIGKRVVRRCFTALAATTALAGLATLGLTVPAQATAAPAASAAERNYEVVLCTDGAYFGSYANVGGYNQYNQYVHTPNFRLMPDHGSSEACGHQPHWWFKPNQYVEINALNVASGNWDRYFMKVSNCRTMSGNASQRFCDLPY